MIMVLSPTGAYNKVEPANVLSTVAHILNIVVHLQAWFMIVKGMLPFAANFTIVIYAPI